MKEKILLLQIAAGGYHFVTRNLGGQKLGPLTVKPLKALFPALTCVVQATMRTASPPVRHGIVANGFFFKEQWKPLFWEQSSRLVQGPRIWERFRSCGGTVAQMFIQQSLGLDSDLLLSPAPIHKHHGGMILDCFSTPPALNKRLRMEIGTVFPLHRYWGPAASQKSSQWITRAVVNVMEQDRPGFLFAYLPHLDYALQRSGPGSSKSARAFTELNKCLQVLIQSAKKEQYRIILFGDYPIGDAHEVIFPNKILRSAGLFSTRNVKGKLYPDYYTSAAFCIVDHQIAHLHLFEPDLPESGRLISGRPEEVKALMLNLPGVDRVLDRAAQAEAGIDHPRSGELVLVAKPGCWFDYRWWDEKNEAPDFASHVDIHNKPGYDPCELLMGWPPFSVSQNPRKIKGTHGRVDENDPVFYASDLELPGHPESLLELAKSIKEYLDR
ncbi:MAG: nucleotide pyrophosphatase/phosphodiesterase family protein [bacterium]